MSTALSYRVRKKIATATYGTYNNINLIVYATLMSQNATAKSSDIKFEFATSGYSGNASSGVTASIAGGATQNIGYLAWTSSEKIIASRTITTSATTWSSTAKIHSYYFGDKTVPFTVSLPAIKQTVTVPKAATTSATKTTTTTKVQTKVEEVSVITERNTEPSKIKDKTTEVVKVTTDTQVKEVIPSQKPAIAQDINANIDTTPIKSATEDPTYTPIDNAVTDPNSIKAKAKAEKIYRETFRKKREHVVINVFNDLLWLVHVIDYHQSLVWTDRFNGEGDFEIVIPYDMYSKYKDYFQIGYYLEIPMSDHTMIIEHIESNIGYEENTVKLQGHSLEGILHRRVVYGINAWGESATMATVLAGLVEANFTKPKIEKRKISLLRISSNIMASEYLTGMSAAGAQVSGGEIYNIIYELCDSLGVGFRILCLDKESDTPFVYDIYQPTIYSADVSDVLLSYTQTYDISAYKNVAVIGGEGEGHNQVVVETNNSISGMNRFEQWVDATDITSTYTDENDKEVTLTDAEYKQSLQYRGNSELTEYLRIHRANGELTASYGWDGSDSFIAIGNVFRISRPGMSSEYEQVWALVSAMTFSDDDSGYSEYPTFEELEDVSSAVEPFLSNV